jgi:3-deoxy-D-manno-octulosonic acid kinase
LRVPEGYTLKNKGKVSVLVREDLIDKACATGIFEERDPRRWQGYSGKMKGGRGVLFRIRLTRGMDMLIKSLCRGGLVRWFNRSLYFSRNRLFQEALLTNHLIAHGVPIAPMLLGRAEYVALNLYRLQLGTLEIVGAVALFDLFTSEPHDTELLMNTMEHAGRTVRALHDAGVYHRDLNLGNLLLASPDPFDTDSPVKVIDLDRSKRYRTLSRKARAVNLARLYRHAVKNRLHERMDLKKYWRSFLFGYCNGKDGATDLETSVEREFKRTLPFHRLFWSMQGK